MKYSFLVVAFALVAMVGCNKSENKCCDKDNAQAVVADSIQADSSSVDSTAITNDSVAVK